MKTRYVFVLFLGLLFASVQLWGQCAVTISASSNTTQLTCTTTSITLQANATGEGLIRYSWSTGATTPSITVTQNGTYTVTITDDSSCTSSSSIIITRDITPPSISVLLIPEAICAGSTTNLIAFGADTYAWSHSGQTTAVVQVSPEVTTTYTVTGTAMNGCTASASRQVDVRPRPSGTISGTVAVCQNASPPPVLFTGSGGTRPYTFTYNVNGGATQTVTTTGTSDQVTLGAPTGTLDTLLYNLVSVADRNGCTSDQSGTAFIIVRPGPVLTSPQTASDCSDVTFRYDATSSATGTSFSWSRAAVPGISNEPGSGSTATISETLENTTALPIEVTYVFSLTTGTGCVTQNIVKVMVNPTPVIDHVEDIIVCNGTFIQSGVPFSSASPGATFTWINDNPNIGLPVSGSGNIPGFIATANTTTRESANIVVSIKSGSGGCEGRSIPFRIIVFPGPVLISPKTASLCDGSLFTYTARSSAEDTKFSWSRAAVRGISNGPRTAGDSTVTERLYNTTSQPVDVYYVFSLSTGTECDTKDSVRVTVNPTPVIDSIPNEIFCNGTSVAGISFTTTSPNPLFTWTNSNPSIGLPAGGSGNIPGFIATNTSAAEIAATITVNVRASADGCPGQSRTFTITVRPGPVLISPKTASVCDGAPFSYTARSSAEGTSFLWQRLPAADITASGPGSDGSATISETLRNNSALPKEVLYVFTLSTGGTCDSKDTLRVTVNPTPAIDTIVSPIYCNGTFVSNGISFSSPSPNATFIWTNSNPSIGLPASGSGNIPGFIATNASAAEIAATITVSIRASADGCPGQSRTFTITVRPGPVLISPKTASVCDGAPFSYTARSSAEGTSFLWQRLPAADITASGPGSDGSATISETLRNNSALPKEVLYVFTLSTGGTCDSKDTLRVTVNPTPVINPIPIATFCNGAFVDGINFSSPSPNASFTWTNGNQAIGLPVRGSGSIPEFTATNNTDVNISAIITVSVTASADACAGQSLQRCSGFPSSDDSN